MAEGMKWWLPFCLLLASCGCSTSVAAHPEIARRLQVLERLVDAGTPRAERTRRVAPLQLDCPYRYAWLRSVGDRQERIDRAVRDASLRWGVDAALIRAVIRHESAGEIWALSSKGAQGLMQLMPGTARELGVRCPFDPRENILGGTRYLRELRDRLGSWRRALAGYHAGPTRVLEERIPRVTRAYVERVLRSWGSPN